jgi:demethylmenaquinone methyltransferase/2-methoxy-6-polyprenyl-1,4-benzoquinol methylase
MTDELLREQVRYYRERAPEYDETSRPPGDPLAAITASAIDDLLQLGPVDRAIELGAGTGQFTGHLAAIAGEVVAVDTSPEMLELNAAKITASNVRRVVADAFELIPAEPAELVAFGFLFSHVPRARLDAFWAAVGRMLVPAGRVFLMDESPHGAWREEAAEADEEVVVRTLGDGRRFRIAKVLWEPTELEARLAVAGWRASLVRRDPFYWGTAERAGGR